jgi:putative flippase GtrA
MSGGGPVRHSLATFLRSNATSILTTAIDFSVLAGLASGLGVNYVAATWVGTVAGSLSNFFINKHWTFGGARHTPSAGQFARFFLVQVGASLLHTGGVWALTRFVGLHYLESKLITATAVFLGWNYPMNVAYVYRHRPDDSGPPAPPAGQLGSPGHQNDPPRPTGSSPSGE